MYMDMMLAAKQMRAMLSRVLMEIQHNQDHWHHVLMMNNVIHTTTTTNHATLSSAT
jgi:hypothetical protein